MQIDVSYHAMVKFLSITRGINLEEIEEPRKIRLLEKAKETILDIFKDAKKEEMHPGLIKRIINNDFTESEYYKNRDWRLVITEQTIVTIEKDKFGIHKKGNFKRPVYRRRTKNRNKKEYANFKRT